MLFSRYPTCHDMAFANQDELGEIIRPLGLWRRRARQLIRMSVSCAFLWDGRDPLDLPGIGKYGSDSWRIFIRGELDIEVEDKELKRYLEWTRTRCRP